MFEASEKDPRLVEFLQKKMKYECVLLRIPIFNEQNFRFFPGLLVNPKGKHRDPGLPRVPKKKYGDPCS